MDVWESRKTLHCLTGRIHQYIEEKLGENLNKKKKRAITSGTKYSALSEIN